MSKIELTEVWSKKKFYKKLETKREELTDRGGEIIGIGYSTYPVRSALIVFRAAVR